MKNNKTAKMGILVVVLLLAVAFAAVTTQLNIGGNASVGANGTEFDENVVFANGENTKAYLLVDGEKQDVTLSNDKKTLTFTTPKFVNSGDNAELHYWVENDSTNYAAKLEGISCTVSTTSEDGDTSYIKVTEGTAHNNVTVNMGETTATDNTVKVELAKTYVGEDETTYTISCTINATGVEQ